MQPMDVFFGSSLKSRPNELTRLAAVLQVLFEASGSVAQQDRVTGTKPYKKQVSVCTGRGRTAGRAQPSANGDCA
jgi:hypothetical protein